MAGRFAMPRLPGGPARDLPPCSRAGHADHKVVKDGRYGSPPRQRFRCAGPDGFHRFVPELPRQRTHDGTCDACDSAVPAHRGPVTGRKYGFPVREVAAALVAVGVGASYQQAALRARARSDLRLLEGAWGGATVAEWLDVLAPFVLDAHAETSWPETLVLDSTRFMSRNVRTGSQRLAFTVLGAYGYPAKGHGRPRVWALAANHHARTADWVDFLRTLDTATPPRLVITDGAEELINAVREVWPADPSQGLPVPFLARCEHHLRENVREELAADQVDHWGSVRMTLLNDAFRSPDGWEKFAGSVWPKHANAWKWVSAHADLVANQVAVRHLLPDHHSAAALDAHLGTVRDFLDSRSFVLRNARRTTTMLGLVRLHLNGVDNTRRYSELLRAHLDARGGVAPEQRNGYDTDTSVHLPRAERQPASLRR